METHGGRLYDIQVPGGWLWKPGHDYTFLYEIEKDPVAVKVDLVTLSARDNEGSQITLGLRSAVCG
jgi:hypothetical protein